MYIRFIDDTAKILNEFYVPIGRATVSMRLYQKDYTATVTVSIDAAGIEFKEYFIPTLIDHMTNGTTFIELRKDDGTLIARLLTSNVLISNTVQDTQDVITLTFSMPLSETKLMFDPAYEYTLTETA